MSLVKNKILPDGPRGPDNFFLWLPIPIPTAKETRSPLISPTSRSIHLFFDLGADLGDISLSGEGVQAGLTSKIYSKNRFRSSKIVSMLLKTVLIVPQHHFWMVQTTRSSLSSSWALRYSIFNFSWQKHHVFAMKEERRGEERIMETSTNNSVKSKMLYLRAQEELGELLVVCTI